MRKKNNLNKFMKTIIEDLKAEDCYGTAHVYQSTLNAFSEFMGCEIIYFHMITKPILKKFEQHLRDKKLRWNTTSTYMRTLRSIYNKAAEQDIVMPNPLLFKHVYTGVKNETKRSLDVEDTYKLLNGIPIQELSDNLMACRVWANLMFQLRGMPFVDLAYLNKSDLQGNTLSYLRRKTGTQMIVEVPPSAMELIEKYKSTDDKSPYLFPILSGKMKDEDLYTEYQQALRKMNYDLKRLAKKCGITQKVSSYTTRHTWATLAKYCNFSESLISEAFGHSSIKVTEAYMKHFKLEEIKKANEMIISYVQKNGKMRA